LTDLWSWFFHGFEIVSYLFSEQVLSRNVNILPPACSFARGLAMPLGPSPSCP
jgi:hypothetical protein